MRPTLALATWTSICILASLSLPGCQMVKPKSETSTNLSGVYEQNERIQTQLAALSNKVDELNRRVSQLSATATYTAAPATTRTIVPEPAPRLIASQSTSTSTSPGSASFSAITPVSSGTQYSSMQPVAPISSSGAATVRVPGAVLFASGHTDLNDSGRELVGRISDVIKREYPNARVLLEGYADTDPISHSSHEDNVALSKARAESVRAEMVRRGIPAASIEAVGRGATNPKPSKALSRRVEISVVVGR